MVAQPAYPEPEEQQQANTDRQPVTGRPDLADDVISYDYGSSEDEASVVVRPYEVPNQVPML
jgi:hypothetical protein